MTRLTAMVAGPVAGVALAVLLWTVLDRNGAPPIVISDPRPDATVVVAVAGAVGTPGVYSLPGDPRVADAIRVAGGALPDADLAGINPAQRLRDEARIVVPGRSPTASAGPIPSTVASGMEASPTPAIGSTSVASGTSTPLDLNRASAAELERLPGLGPVLAQRIVDYRAANGPFMSVDELAEVSGISPRMVDELRTLVTVGP
jgi:competence protein ComEA